MRAFQKYIGLLCSDQLLRSYGHKRYLGSVPIAAESTAVGPSMVPLVAAAEVAHGLGRRRSRVVGCSPGPGEQPTCLGCLLLSPSATSVTVARHGASKPASTVVGATVHHSGRQWAHEVIPCQTCDVRPAMTYGSHLTCMGALQARFLRYHGHYDLMGRLPTAVVHRGAHDGRCWL